MTAIAIASCAVVAEVGNYLVEKDGVAGTFMECICLPISLQRLTNCCTKLY